MLAVWRVVPTGVSRSLSAEPVSALCAIESAQTQHFGYTPWNVFARYYEMKL